MIKNILLICFNLIMIVVIIVSAIKGINISQNFEILSYSKLGDMQSEYAQKIQQRDDLIKNDYNTWIKTLKESQDSFNKSKQKYDQIKNMSSYNDLVRLSRNMEYRIESLWIKLDLPAKNNNLKANFQLQNSTNDVLGSNIMSNILGIGKNDNAVNQNDSKNLYTINVTLEGDYLSIRNYIYDIMIDMDMQFKAENILIEKVNGQGRATFQIKNVKILM